MNADYFNIVAEKIHFPLIQAFKDALWPEGAARRNLFLEQVVECLRYNNVSMENANKAAAIIHQPASFSGSLSLISYACNENFSYGRAMNHFVKQFKTETDSDLEIPDYLKRNVETRLSEISGFKDIRRSIFEPQ